jgi:hypothetical protein
MGNESTGDRRDKAEQETRRDPRSRKPQSTQILPPLIIDGLESVRDPNC